MVTGRRNWKVETATPEMCPRESPEKICVPRQQRLTLRVHTHVRNREMTKEKTGRTDSAQSRVVLVGTEVDFSH